MGKWLALALGIALATATGVWLWRSHAPPAAVSAEPASDAHGQIDDQSRKALEKVLEQIDEKEEKAKAADEEGQKR